MKKYLLLFILFLYSGCYVPLAVRQEIFLNYNINEQNEPVFSISEDSLNHLQKKGISPLLIPHPADLKKLCPTCTLNINNPTIGILLARSSTDKTQYELSAEYVYPLIKANANVRFISYDNIAFQLQSLDGILLPGGAFPSPEKWYFSYKEEKFDKPQKRYYAYEYLIRHAQKEQIPLLGICAGMQIMSALLSNEKVKFFDDLEKVSSIPHKKLDKYQQAHFITITPGTILYKIFQTTKLKVNSRHKVGLSFDTTKDIPQVIPSALSPDGVVEAMEFSIFPTALGVQFHPEVFAAKNDKTMQEIFNWFVNNAYKHQQKEIKK